MNGVLQNQIQEKRENMGVRIDRIKMITIMAKKNLKVKDVAELTGITRNTISAIKNGKSCSETNAVLISKALNVELSKLLETF